MSDAGGTDNPVFSNADESIDMSANHENGCSESLQQHENNTDNKLSPTSNGRSFVSQHYVEPTRNSPQAQYKTETRIEVPGEKMKTPNNGKANGVHGNGNNNDVSFLNTSAANVQNNDGKKEQIEAVNLELVSMRPYTANNLQTKGQEACELPNEPYEEYFVPVNEHRKYIRGEKLYVTKDKRSKGSYWRRIGCWIFGLTVLALALVIAILAATGVILTQEATKPLENDQPRLLDDVNAAGSQEFIKNPPASPPPETSSFPPWQTTDESTIKIVPEALDGSIWLDNLAWGDDFKDVKSRVYRSVAGEIEDNLRNMLHSTASMVMVKIYNITANGQVMFRIIHPSTLEPNLLQESIEKRLRENSNMIGKYHLNRMNIKHLVDECEYNNFDCFASCKFDYFNGVFGCTCPPGQPTDVNGKSCISESDLSNVNMDDEDSRSTTIKDVFQGRSQAPDYPFESRGHDDQMHHLLHDHNHHDHHEHGHGDFDTESPPKSEPKSVGEPTSELRTESEDINKSISEPKSEPELSSEPTSEPKSEPESSSEPTSEPKSVPEPSGELTPEPQLAHEHSSESTLELISESEASIESTLEPKSKPAPSSEPKSESDTTTISTSESGTVFEPINQSTLGPTSVFKLNASTELDSFPNYENEPSLQPNFDYITTLSSIDPEPIFKSESEPRIKSESTPDLSITPDGDPKLELALTTVLETSPQPVTDLNQNFKPNSEPSVESRSKIEPTLAPKSTTEESIEIIAIESKIKSSDQPITTPEPVATMDSTVESLDVIPLNSTVENTYSAHSFEDSTTLSTLDERIQTTQEILEMLPTAIPKTSVQHLHDYLHDEYERRSNENLFISTQDEREIIGDLTTTESSTSTALDSVFGSEEQSTKVNLKDSSIDSMSTISDVTTMNSNDSDNFDTTIKSDVIINTTILPSISKINRTVAQLTPEPIDPYALIHNVLGIDVTTGNPIRNSSISNDFLSEIPVNNNEGSKNTEKPIETITMIEEKHADDMSPFLPDVIREREASKKAPRLDKDEQDFPNPFEPHVEDVIVHHHSKTDSTMTSNNNANGTEFTDLNNDTHLSHDAHQTGTTREEDVSMLDMMTAVTSTISKTGISSDVGDLEQSLIDDMNSKRLTNDTDDERGNDADFNNNKTNDDIYVNLRYNNNFNTIHSVSEKIHKGLHDKNNKTLTIKNKIEDNIEDQYNDINDENILNKFDVDEEKNSKLPKKNSADVQVNTGEVISIIKSSKSTEMPEDMQTIMSFTVGTENIKTTTSEPTSMKLVDDNKFTTEMPIMPMEIMEDITTTEMIENTNSTFIAITENIITDFPITSQMSMTETKTTAQVPILPDELRTTEATSTDKIPIDINITTELLSSSTESESHMKKDNKTTITADMPETTTVSDIKPVSEMIADDPIPAIFDVTRFFTTSTEQVLLTTTDKKIVDDEKLKVISLDDEYQNEDATSDESSEKNRFNYSKFKTLEIISASKSPEMKHSNDIITTPAMILMTESMAHILTTAQTPRKIPEIIPVYEPIEENEENPMLKPLHSSINQSTNITVNTGAEGKEKETMNLNVTGVIPNSTTDVQNDSKPFIFSKCNAGQFQCTNGTSRDGAYCVNLSSKCDSENDCSDGSDELNCEDAGCLGNFQCLSGQCLGRHLVCNGIGDCDDGSDEEKCDEWMCQFDEFKCPNGRCIPEIWRCNGRPDCEDHRDEYSCSKSCGNDEYLCPSENWCIPQTWRCNNVPECADGEDEKLCDCALDQFKCQTGGCIALNQVCDGIEHCPDLSDEWDCLIANISRENISSIQNNDEITAAIGQQPILLKIKQSDNKRYMVCTDNWNKNVSDIYCRSLGYFGSEITQTLIQKNEGEKFLRLKDNYRNYDWNFVSYLEISDSCKTGEVVKISCQEFSCSSEPDNEGPTARLVGGYPAGEGQWSSVTLLKEMKNGAACTASVLGPMHALASYSCIHKYRQSDHWELYLGRDLQKSIRVKNIIPYPQVKYNQFLYNNDIALIQLEQPLVFSRNISAVCLPTQQLQPRALCVTAGWGFPINGDINLKLNFLPIPIYNTEECNATHHYDGFITQSNICAGFTGTDKGTCYNDEGAPLMCATETGRWEIHGLLSHHSRCSRGHPAIYSSLGPAISWLQHLIPALQIQT